MKIEHYVQYLRQLGFKQEQAETIAEGREIAALPDREFMQFIVAWEGDEVEPMKPLVEKYGWSGLVERLGNSIDK